MKMKQLNKKFKSLNDFKNASEKELLEYALQVAEKIRDENLPIDLDVITDRSIMGWMLYFAGMPATIEYNKSYFVDAHYLDILGIDKYKAIFGISREGTLNDRIERIKQEIALEVHNEI